MSGGDRSSSGSTNNPVVNCETLSTVTQLSSPQPNVVKKLSVGDQLELVTVGSTVQAQFNGEVAGTITWAQLARLIECMDDGHTYVAQVTKIDSGAVKLRIFAV